MSQATSGDRGNGGRLPLTRRPVGTPAHPQPDPQREQVLAQLKVWSDHLVDLTRANPLLGVNRARTSKLQVAAPVSSELFDALVVRGTALRLPVVRKRPVVSQALSAQASPLPQQELAPTDAAEGGGRPSPWLLQEGDIRFIAEPAELHRRLKRIRDNARTTVEERGVTTLHLTLGAVEWDDPLLGASVAPLWLIPCMLESTGPDEPLLLTATDEDAQLNPALEIFLRERFKKLLPGLPEEPTAGILNGLLSDARQSLGGEFQVSDQSWLSTFSFETLTMYKDLGTLAEAAVAHDVVRAFSRASVQEDAGASERLADDLDSEDTAALLPIPVLPADSSQLEALGYARQGRHLLVFGPPGTGKSQTISNLMRTLSVRAKPFFS